MLLVGTNNYDHTAEQVVGGILEIVSQMLNRQPQAQLIVMVTDLFITKNFSDLFCIAVRMPQGQQSWIRCMVSVVSQCLSVLVFLTYAIKVQICGEVYSFTGQRSASYCLGIVSAVHLSVCLSVHKFFLQKTSPQKLLTGFLPNFTGMFIRWSSFKFLQIIVCHGNQSKKPLKIFSFQTTNWIALLFCSNVP